MVSFVAFTFHRGHSSRPWPLACNAATLLVINWPCRSCNGNCFFDLSRSLLGSPFSCSRRLLYLKYHIRHGFVPYSASWTVPLRFQLYQSIIIMTESTGLSRKAESCHTDCTQPFFSQREHAFGTASSQDCAKATLWPLCQLSPTVQFEHCSLVKRCLLLTARTRS
jgi:hypothetical protein